MDPSLKHFLRCLRRQQRVLDAHLARIFAQVEQGRAVPEPGSTTALWSEKECATTAIVKLSQVQIKWAEMEFEVLRLLHGNVQETATAQPDAALDEKEYRLLCEALRRDVEASHPMPLTPAAEIPTGSAA